MIQNFNPPGQGTHGQVYIGDLPIPNYPLYPCLPHQPIYPVISYPHTYIGVSPGPHPIYPIQMRKVENGFIVLKDGIEYVFNEIKDLVQFMEKEMKN